MVVFFDIDGTVVDDDTQIIPESAVRAVERLKENGHLAVVNTGRPYSHIDPRVRQMAFGGWICGCGMEIRLYDGWLVRRAPDTRVCAKIRDAVRACGMRVLYEGQDGDLFTDGAFSRNETLELEAERMRRKGFRVRELEPQPRFLKLVTYDAPNCRREEFIRMVSPWFTCIDRGNTMLELVMNGFSKAGGMALLLTRLGLPREGLAVTIAAEIPVCRGLGSSAALIAGGAAAANLLHGAPLSRAELLDVTNAIEGHPDNLAPAIFGGLTASLVEEGHAHTVQLPLCQRLRWVAAVPDFELSTHTARGVLPAAVPFADAVYNASRAAVLVGALACGDHDLLRCALRDRLHQPYRYALIPEAGAVETTARECGALAFCISGAGPTLLCLTDDPGFSGRLTERCAAF